MKAEFRDKLARLPFEEKIRKVGELIQLSRKVKISSENAFVERLDRAAAELDASRGVPIAQVREDIEQKDHLGSKKLLSATSDT